MRQFLDRLNSDKCLNAVARVTVTLYGSLAFTGKGHGTDRALVLGLLGEIPSEIDPETVTVAVDKVIDSGRLQLDGTAEIPFSISEDILFEYGAPLDEHTNGLRSMPMVKNWRLKPIFRSAAGSWSRSRRWRHLRKVVSVIPTCPIRSAAPPKC